MALTRCYLTFAAVLLATLPSGRAAASCTVAPPLPGTARPARLSLVDVPDAFPEVADKLAKGMTVTLVHEVSRSGQASLVFGCRVYYDLWDESYGVTTFLGDGAETKHIERDRKKVMSLCDDAPLDGPPGAEVSVTTRLDPVSDDQLEKTRQWLASRGIGNSSKAIVGRAVGAMISLKEERSVTRICTPAQTVTP